jgi:hypothetical protein
MVLPRHELRDRTTLSLSSAHPLTGFFHYHVVSLPLSRRVPGIFT